VKRYTLLFLQFPCGSASGNQWRPDADAARARKSLTLVRVTGYVLALP
jgi:hypothetical protein